MIKSKPHSGDDILVVEKNAFGETSYRFTDAWYNYFDSVDGEINVTINQSINQVSGGGTSTATTALSWQISEVEDRVSRIASEIRISSLESEVEELKRKIAEVVSICIEGEDRQQVDHYTRDIYQEIEAKTDPCPRSHSHSIDDITDFGDYLSPGDNISLLANDSGFAQIASVPASASATGVAGQIAYESGFFYVCVATDTWERTVLATWV